jgi:hypothetical protein
MFYEILVLLEVVWGYSRARGVMRLGAKRKLFLERLFLNLSICFLLIDHGDR